MLKNMRSTPKRHEELGGAHVGERERVLDDRALARARGAAGARLAEVPARDGVLEVPVQLIHVRNRHLNTGAPTVGYLRLVVFVFQRCTSKMISIQKPLRSLRSEMFVSLMMVASGRECCTQGSFISII